MAGKRKKKKGLIVLIVVLVILVAAIWAGKTFVYDKAKEKVTSAVAEGQRRSETVRQREVYRERDPADERPL